MCVLHEKFLVEVKIIILANKRKGVEVEKVRGEIGVDRAIIIRLKSTLISGASTVRYFPSKKKQNLSELAQKCTGKKNVPGGATEHRVGGK
jgi:hypothetical protein